MTADNCARPLLIGDRAIGPGNPCFVIAEAGVNHNGSLEMAFKLVDVAVEAGADAVKFQTFTADRLVTPTAPKAPYQAELTGAGESQFDMLRRLELPPDHHVELLRHCQERGILFLSTPFDESAADFLEELGVAAFKVGSGDLTNIPFLVHLARKQRPVLISTGMATMDEVAEAAEALGGPAAMAMGIFHCVSCYPAAPGEVNLRAMDALRQRFPVAIGYSDHTEGCGVAVAAAALGANMIEKHFTLDRSLPGPDHKASLEPAELKQMIAMLRDAESALGSGDKVPVPRELETARVARKSVVVVNPVARGGTIGAADIAVRRPEGGLHPRRLADIPGHRAARDLSPGKVLMEQDIE